MNSSLKSNYLYCILVCSFLFAEDLVYEYNISEGANLVSFPLISDNYSIEYFLSSSNTSLFSNYTINDKIKSLISEGELAFYDNGNWVGSLEEIDTKKGYWLISEEDFSFVLISNGNSENLYYMHPGSNLISYPFNVEKPYYEAIPFLSDNLLAVLGENEALLNNNGMLMGSLSHFKPGKGYWFILNDYAPFQFNESTLNSNNNYHIEPNLRDNEILNFNQSTLQTALFIESIYISGNKNSENINLEAICNNNIVGHSKWKNDFSDLIVMGDDGFAQTQDYCYENQNIIIRNSDTLDQFFNLSGSKQWSPNNFEVLILSDSNHGDLNFNQIINISDVVILIEHLMAYNIFENEHQELLADLNKDDLINISDVVSIITQILEQ